MSSSLIPLSSLLKEATFCLKSVKQGKSLNEVLPQVAHKAATQSIVFYCLRQYYLIQALKALLLDKKAPNTTFDALLLVSLSLLLPHTKTAENNDWTPVYDPFTVVDQAVRCAMKDKKTQAFKGLLNACLRRFLREQDALIIQVSSLPEVKTGFPNWWQQVLQKDYGSDASNVMDSLWTPGPMSLRVNQRQHTVTAYLDLLMQHGISAQAVGEQGVVLKHAVPVDALPGFFEGACSVQDVGAQKAATLLPLRDGMRVLDACSAPGGKTAHILERADVELIALDISEQRLEKVADNLERLQLFSEKVQLKAANAADLKSWWDGQPFDVILADVPCTASGIVRRHPDIRLLRQESDVAQIATLQREIVDQLWQTLKPGGMMVYATCSVFQAEGQAQMTFFSQLPGARVLSTEQLLPNSIHDGFFYATIEKHA